MIKNKITLNVLADITKRLNGTSDNIRAVDVSSKNTGIIVFTGSNVDITEKIAELKRIKEKGFAFSVAFSFVGDKLLPKDYIINSLTPIEIFGEEDIVKIEEIIEKYSILISPNITLNTVAKVATGVIDTFASNLLWNYLYEGKLVYLDFDSVRKQHGKPSQNKVINNLIENHIRILKEMGVKEIERGRYEEIINGELSGVNPSFKEVNEKNRVITVADLKNIAPNSVLSIPAGAIITPLAKEVASQMGIKLEIGN
ncbi:hypothetical protein [Caldanaerobacter subterraneus]|uniref:Ethanolamine utilization protein n=1 Tax=Caldanaerobacter subterraneus TaxID=911092 RepID=A0A7Y2L7Q1_9THEO|nr:hypothetical protein [Caldanaerobacter subterraneus]NNG65926.1 hypothetical protein [Caldanaerobacter subterraneus]